MSQKAIAFRSRSHLYTGLTELATGIDLNKSLGMPYFCIAHENGKQYVNKTFAAFLKDLNEHFGTKIVIDKCIYRRNSFVIVVEESVKTTARVVEVIEEVKEVETSEVATEEETQVIDVAHAESLFNADNKTESKKALEEYAREYGIELDKRASFQNMIIELQSKI